MKSLVVLKCATIALGLWASPLAAQSTPVPQVDQREPVQTVPTTPNVPQPPPPTETQALPPPPPFPPMPAARPSHRWVDIGDGRTTRHHRHARVALHRTTRTQIRRSSPHKARSAPHFSRRTIRSCHNMNYRQIMRRRSCREVMGQELARRARQRRHAVHRHHATGYRTRRLDPVLQTY
jgi:hypothetical protein